MIVLCDTLGYLSGAEGFASMGGYYDPTSYTTPRLALYPPGNSLLLTLPRLFIGPHCDHPISWFRYLSIQSFVCLGVIFFCLRAFGLNRLPAALFVGCMGITTIWQWTTLNCWPDAPYTACIMTSFVVATRLTNKGVMAAICVGLLMAAAWMLRPAALLFFTPLAIAAIGARLRGFLSTSAVLIMLAIPLLSQGLWLLNSGGGLTYSQSLMEQSTVDSTTIGRIGRVMINCRGLVSGELVFDCILPLVNRFLSWSKVRLGAETSVTLIAIALVQLAIFGSAARYCMKAGNWIEKMALAGVCISVAGVAAVPGSMPRHMFALIPFVFCWFWKSLEFASAKTACLIRGGVLLTLGVQFTANFFLTTPIIDRGLIGGAASQRKEMDEVASFILANVETNEIVGAHVFIDTLHLHHRTGRAFLADYLVRTNLMRFVSHRQQGFSRADYLITTGDGLPSHLGSGLLQSLFTSTYNSYSVWRVSKNEEQAWRVRTAYPSPVSVSSASGQK